MTTTIFSVDGTGYEYVKKLAEAETLQHFNKVMERKLRAADINNFDEVRNSILAEWLALNKPDTETLCTHLEVNARREREYLRASAIARLGTRDAILRHPELEIPSTPDLPKEAPGDLGYLPTAWRYRRELAEPWSEPANWAMRDPYWEREVSPGRWEIFNGSPRNPEAFAAEGWRPINEAPRYDERRDILLIAISNRLRAGDVPKRVAILLDTLKELRLKIVQIKRVKKEAGQNADADDRLLSVYQEIVENYNMLEAEASVVRERIAELGASFLVA